MRYLRALFTIFLLCIAVVAKSQLNTERVMLIGRNALYFEDYVLSIKYFNMVIGVRPNLSEPYFFRGLAKYNLDDYKGASDDLTLSISKNPYVSKSYQLRGLCRVFMEQYDSAESDFRRAIHYEPQNVGVWNNLVLCVMQRERWDEADLLLDSVMQIAPRNSDVYLKRMQVAIKKGDTIAARKWVDEAVRLDSYSADVYQARAMLFAQTEDYPAAEEDMNRAIELMPTRSGYYINRALVRYYRENLRGAMSDYDLALTADPDNLLGYYNRGLLRAQVGDDNRAIEDFDYVLREDAENLLARFNRALLRDKTGDVKGAIEDYSLVLNEYPNFEYGYQCRAAARRKIGDEKGALDDETWLLKYQLAQYTNAGKGNNAEKDSMQTDEKIRKNSDRNVRKYNRMVVADDGNSKQYTTEYRGKVQNRNVDVQLEPMFALTYYEKPRDVGKALHYYKPLADINSRKLFPHTLLLTNDERGLSENEVQRHFDDINIRSKYIVDDAENISHRMSRALDFSLVQDFTSAMNDLNEALAMEGDLWLVYFMRATVRCKLLETEELNKNIDDKNSFWEASVKNNLPNINYHLVRNDLTQVITLMPDFEYAYFNRGNVFVKLADFKSAVVDYSEAIKLDNAFAEAYFNRGLAYIYLGKTAEGIADLSKAGELGLYSAYNIIKRFKDK
ncbi:MAG: tetratricopeptide repeat protein [Bacteroidaceae bacterium]|nr:tetratricopeptide repeat protein [Bacteroidaceae bacterium]